MDHFMNFINGEWVEALSGDRSMTHNPARISEELGTFPKCSAQDVERAIGAAQDAFSTWAATPAPARGAILLKASQLLEARLQETAQAMTREEGKTLAESRAEVGRAVEILRFFAGEGWRSGGAVYPSSVAGELLYSRREPLGVVSIITPWNFPIAIPAWKIAPALVYGNTVVFKPAGHGEQSGLALVQAFADAGLPPGVLNFITGPGSVMGQALVSSPTVKGVSFTGSHPVGTHIYTQAIPNLSRVQLEMGGKNPMVVLDDADLDLAVTLAARSGFGLTGQACTAASRIIVQNGIADRFRTGLEAIARKWVIGDGLDPATNMGPAVSQAQLETDLEYIQVGQSEGARLVAGGAAGPEGGYFIQPTLFDEVHVGMRLAQEEIFGPVICLIRVENLDEAIERANSISFGLSASIMTRDLHKAFHFANAVEAGVVKVNEPTTGLAVNAPFGGFKNSSANTFKEQGPAALEFYTRQKTIYVNHG